MEWITTNAAPANQGGASKRAPRHLQSIDFSKSDGEPADPAFWTAYDLHMIDSEARAARRAHAYAIVVACLKRLQQRIGDFRIARSLRHSAP